MPSAWAKVAGWRQHAPPHRPVLKNPKLLKNIIQVIQEAGAESGCSKAQGALLNAIATKVCDAHHMLRHHMLRHHMHTTQFPANALHHRRHLARAVISGEIKVWFVCVDRLQSTDAPQSNLQMDAALDFFKKLGEGDLQEDVFREVAGVGVEVPLSDIAAAVAAEIEKNRAALLEERCVSIAPTMHAVPTVHTQCTHSTHTVHTTCFYHHAALVPEVP